MDKPETERSRQQNLSLINEKGKKRMRGQPVFYEEKKLKRSVMLTDTTWEAIGNFAKAIGKSKSEWLELHIRGITGQIKNKE